MFEPDNYEDLISKLKIIENTEILKKIGTKNQQFIKKLIDEEKIINNLGKVFQ